MTETNLPQRPKSTKICSIPECDRPQKAKGYCSKHHLRLCRRGTVELKNKHGVGNTFAERFWSLVAVAEPDHCWLWQAGKAKAGYGQAWFNGKVENTHRIAWYLVNGKWSANHILHSCDNPPCCNPNHLREGTDQDNSNDKQARGRMARGEKIYGSKLTEENVREIRQMLANGMFQREIAERFGVKRTAISAISTHRHWEHVK